MAYRDEICDALEDAVEDAGITATVEKYGTVFLTYFMEEAPQNYTDVLENDVETYMDYRWGMVDRGVMMVPKNARRNYITEAHDEEDARRTIEAAQDVLAELGE